MTGNHNDRGRDVENTEAGDSEKGVVYLGAAAKQLAQDALFHVVQLPDAGCNRSHKHVVDVGLRTQCLQPVQGALLTLQHAVSHSSWHERAEGIPAATEQDFHICWVACNV